MKLKKNGNFLLPPVSITYVCLIGSRVVSSNRSNTELL